MPLFEYEQLLSLNERETMVCNYVTSNVTQIEEMTIRQLAEATGISTTTILRFCAKVGCEGFQDLKFKLRQYREQESDTWSIPQDGMQVLQFLQGLKKNEDMQKRLQQAADCAANAREVYFIGVGSSASLAEYGARYFANLQLPAVSVVDPFYPKPTRNMTGDVLIALSVSGETEQIIYQSNDYRTAGASIISITNAGACRLASLSDINLNYYMPVFYSPQHMGPHNLTTQLPVIYLLETLARQAARVREK